MELRQHNMDEDLISLFESISSDEDFGEVDEVTAPHADLIRRVLDEIGKEYNWKGNWLDGSDTYRSGKIPPIEDILLDEDHIETNDGMAHVYDLMLSDPQPLFDYLAPNAYLRVRITASKNIFYISTGIYCKNVKSAVTFLPSYRLTPTNELVRA